MKKKTMRISLTFYLIIHSKIALISFVFHCFLYICAMTRRVIIMIIIIFISKKNEDVYVLKRWFNISPLRKKTCGRKNGTALRDLWTCAQYLHWEFNSQVFPLTYLSDRRSKHENLPGRMLQSLIFHKCNINTFTGIYHQT